MGKTILLTGATDGIGFETAKKLASLGHRVLLHGRNGEKLANAKAAVESLAGVESVELYQADLANLSEVTDLANSVTKNHKSIDVLINNAGVFKVPNPRLSNGLDLRFLVNTIAPYLLTQELLPLLAKDARVVNLSSAAQAPVNIQALNGEVPLNDSEAYAQSKLAITMWSFHLASQLQTPAFIAVNPASFLGSKMVKEAYGAAGKDLAIGADILVRAALDDQFADASGKYYDNDIQQFSSPMSDALDPKKNAQLVVQIEDIIQRLNQ